MLLLLFTAVGNVILIIQICQFERKRKRKEGCWERLDEDEEELIRAVSNLILAQVEKISSNPTHSIPLILSDGYQTIQVIIQWDPISED